MKRPKHEVVLRYLLQGEGERKIKLYPEHPLEFGMHDNKLCHILWNNGDEMWCISDMTLNEFIRNCNQISDADIVDMCASIALTELKKVPRENKSTEINI